MLGSALQRRGDGTDQRNSAFLRKYFEGSFEVCDLPFTKLPICPVVWLSQQNLAAQSRPYRKRMVGLCQVGFSWLYAMER